MDYQIVISLKMKWQITDLPNYKWTTCKRLFNTKTGREIKKTVNGGSIGYWVGKQFVPISKLKNRLSHIPVSDCPF